LQGRFSLVRSLCYTADPSLSTSLILTSNKDPPEYLPHATELSTAGKVASEILKELTNMIIDLLIARQDAGPIGVTVSFPSNLKKMKSNGTALQEFVTE
jgi:hypothetical protein